MELSLELTPTVAPQFAEDEELEDSHAPQSTDNLDWATMASKVGGWVVWFD